ncbi:MAG: retroviral-like aspartic protease family protein [Microcoleaceae cyanobacterium]
MNFSRCLQSGLALLSFCGSLALISTPVMGSLAIEPLQQPWAKTRQLISQSPLVNSETLGRQLIQEISQCMAGAFANTEPGTPQEVQAASMKCTIQTIILDAQGKIRLDASDRMGAVLTITGTAIPKTSSQGQAAIQLQTIPEGQVFTVPVTIGGQSRQFLLDTGASNSILSQQIVQQLGLLGMPIPSDLLSYFVVGDDCSNVQASLHRLPPVSVDEAQVEGMSGMGLSQSSIPGNTTGVLGMDFLKGFEMIIDPKALTLKLLPPASGNSPGIGSENSPGNKAIPLQGKLGVMIAQVYINGQGPFPFLLDTGADLMVVSQRLAERLSLDRDAEDLAVQGFCGEELGKKTQLNSVRLQHQEQPKLEAVILDNELLDLIGVEGIVGQNYLTQYRQHWRFSESNNLGFPETGSLLLSPL